LAPHQQKSVMERGSLEGARDPSAVLITRVRDAMMDTSAGQMSAVANPEVEAFIAQNPVEQHAASRLRSLPPHQQKLVLERGTLNTARDPSAVLITRIRDAMASGSSGPVVTVSNPEVEAFIQKNPVEQHAAQKLRALTPHQQKAVMERGSLNSARDPSAVLVSRVRDAISGKLQPAPVTSQEAEAPPLQLTMDPHNSQHMGMPPGGMPGGPPPPPPDFGGAPFGQMSAGCSGTEAPLQHSRMDQPWGMEQGGPPPGGFMGGGPCDPMAGMSHGMGFGGPPPPPGMMPSFSPDGMVPPAFAKNGGAPPADFDFFAQQGQAAPPPHLGGFSTPGMTVEDFAML